LKYSVIYADPPWHYRNYEDTTASRWVGNHYAVLDVPTLKTLPISEIAADDCALFLWTTPPCLQEALTVLTAWGFEYKTKAFCWVKQNKKADSLFWGMGYWSRSNTEDCWLATRGRPKRVDAGVHQVVLSHVGEHSSKPDEVRDRIVKLCGDVPRIELFARSKAGGWDSIGDGVTDFDIRISLAKIIAGVTD
jgi:N6-adenosine-specific RNA methylase IME4